MPDVRLTAARVDVYADWLGLTLSAGGREDFVCRAGRLTTHEQGTDWTGFEFGRRSTGTVAARIYDKTLQAAEGGHDWWCDVWQRPLDPGNPVIRVEFEVGRQGLREFGVDTAKDAITAAPRLWRALTESWLTHREPNADSNRSRWPVSAEWAQVQAASFAANAVGLERVRAGRSRGSLRRLAPALVGYMATAGAHLGVDDLSGTLQALPGVVRDHELASGVAFAERVRAKRRSLELA